MTEELARPTFDPAELPVIEDQLEAIARSVEKISTAESVADSVGLALVRRGIGYWRAIRLLSKGPSLPAMMVLLRQFDELLILLVWVASEEKEHFMRWAAESERGGKNLYDAIAQGMNEGRKSRITAQIPPERVAEMRTNAAAGKSVAANIGEVRLVPSIEDMVKQSGDPVSREAYHLGYRSMSAWSHIHAGTFVPGDAGDNSFVDAPIPVVPWLCAAASIVAAVLLIGALIGNLPETAAVQDIRMKLLAPSVNSSRAIG
jgi:hypothetical protein